MVEICKGFSGILIVYSFGGFVLFKGFIKWKYGYLWIVVYGEILVDDFLFEFLLDFKKFIVKEFKKYIWICVEGIFYMGIFSVLVEFKLKCKFYLFNRLRFLRVI